MIKASLVGTAGGGVGLSQVEYTPVLCPKAPDQPLRATHNTLIACSLLSKHPRLLLSTAIKDEFGN